ncbi:DUF397 domain-containing protein [Streptomyces antibioticus]|uniref:DUF397 domain-containing protein n=1 Tax=Streptomyces antibioticus TaxID=1890 RepID=UPI0019609AA3|nr:DUF397 domain-containing protein [Streptomyces sp. S9]
MTTLPDNWQKSSYSGPDDGNACIELAYSQAALHLRESDCPFTVLTTSVTPVHNLLRAIRDGDL